MGLVLDYALFIERKLGKQNKLPDKSRRIPNQDLLEQKIIRPMMETKGLERLHQTFLSTRSDFRSGCLRHLRDAELNLIVKSKVTMTISRDLIPTNLTYD